MPRLDRAHRNLNAKPKEGEPPCPMVIRVTQFQLRNDILHAGQRGPLLYKEKRVFIFLDFTPAVAKRRATFIKVKRELHAYANVRFGLRYPATHDHCGLTHKFEDLDKALEFVNKRLKKRGII